MMNDKRTWVPVLLLMFVLLIPGLLSPVTAFKVSDHSMCKDIEWSNMGCKDRTAQFRLTDDWAYFWMKGATESTDIGNNVLLNVYSPDGRIFTSASRSLVVHNVAETVGWIGIGITKNVSKGAFVHPATDPAYVKKLFELMGGGITSASVFSCCEFWAYETVKPAFEMPGEWRVEFTVGENIVVRERFTIGDKVTLTININPGKASVPVSIDGTSTNTDATGKVQVKVSITGSHTVQVPSEASIGAGARAIFMNWEDGSTSNPRTVTTTGDMKLVARYKAQYLLSVNSPTGNAQGSGWYDERSTATFSVTSPWPVEGIMGLLGGKHIFERWSGDAAATTTSASVRMDGPKTVTAEWRTDNTMPYITIGAIGAAIIVIVVLTVVMKRRKK